MNTNSLLDGRLKLRHLVLVDVLTEAGTVVGAAAALHVTQPVVTRSLKELEQVLGVTLYERGPRGITPTEHGIVFTQHARQILAQVRIAGRHLAEVSDATRGEVRVGTHLAGSHFLLPRAIARLSEIHPQLTVTVKESSPDQLLVDLRAGRLDMLIGRLPDSPDSDVDQIDLIHDDIRLVVGTHHPLARQAEQTGEVEPADLRDHHWVLPGLDTRLRTELEMWLTARGISVPAGVVEASNFLTVRRLLIDSDRIAAMPGLLAEEDSALVPLPLELGKVGTAIGATLIRGRRLSPVVHEMLRVVRSVADDLLAMPEHAHLAAPHPQQAARRAR